MGNLYTQIQRIPNERLNILSQLKYEYKCTPRNYTQISILKKKLSEYDSKNKPKRNKPLFPKHDKYVAKWLHPKTANWRVKVSESLDHRKVDTPS